MGTWRDSHSTDRSSNDPASFIVAAGRFSAGGRPRCRGRSRRYLAWLSPPVRSDVPTRSFAPIAAAGAHTLILGSMPGAASLAAVGITRIRQSLRPIIGAVLGIDPRCRTRTTRLLAKRLRAMGRARRMSPRGSHDRTSRPSRSRSTTSRVLLHHPRSTACLHGTLPSSASRQRCGAREHLTSRSRLHRRAPLNASIPYPGSSPPG